MAPTFGKRFLRIVAFVLSFVSGAGAVWMISDFCLEATHSTRSPMTLDILGDLRAWQLRMLAEEVHPRVALIGDSVLLADVGSKAVWMDIERTFYERGELGVRPPVLSLGWPGLGPIGQYCLVDEIVGAKPDLIALEINLRGLQAGSLGPMGFPELAGYIHANRLPEAMSLPLWDAGITLDRLLLYQAIIAGGFESDWVAFLDRQARMLHLQGRADTWVESTIGGDVHADRLYLFGLGSWGRNLLPGKNRGQRHLILSNLRGAIEGVPPDGARLRVLDATIRAFRRAGIPVLAWVAPLNVTHLKSLGFSMDGVARTVYSARQVAEGAGAMFVDFHFLLPDAGFRDSGDHVTIDGEVDGSAVLGSRLAFAIAAALKQASPSHPPRTAERGNGALQ